MEAIGTYLEKQQREAQAERSHVTEEIGTLGNRAHNFILAFGFSSPLSVVSPDN
jgi:hypothetical protein